MIITSASHRLVAVDALRGVAVLAVLLFHAFPAFVPLGFLGVDVFFVVSGYVIARTYLFRLANRETKWTSFWTRRFRRLFPAYAACILLTSIPAFLVLEPHLLKAFGTSLLYQPFYLQNVAFWLEGDYFNNALSKPLLHTWSLAIEEQFYLFFFVPVLLYRFRRSLVPLVVCLVLAAVGSYWAMSMLASISPKTAFYLLPFRAWQFIVGILAFALVDALSLQAKKRSQSALALVGALMLLLGIIIMRPAADGAVTTETTALITLLTGVIVVLSELCAVPARPYKLLFSPFEWMGKVSYSLYLWHWPLISLLAIHLNRSLTYVEATLMLVASVAAGALSWRYIEVPGRELTTGKQILGLTVAGNVLVALIGVSLVATDGALQRYPEPERTWLRVSQERSPHRCPYRQRVFNIESELCRRNDQTGKGGLLIIGDSHADQIDEMVARLGDEMGVPVFLTTRNCDIDRYFTHAYCNKAVVTRLLDQIEDLGITHILAVSKWTGELPESDFERGIKPFLDKGLKVTVSRTTPGDPYFNPRERAALALNSTDESSSTPEFRIEQLDRDNRGLDKAMHALLASHPDSVGMIDASPSICPDASENCIWKKGDLPLYFDNSHLSQYGITEVEPYYRRYIQQDIVDQAE